MRSAFFSLATLAVVLAAQAQIACTRQIAMDMPMPIAGGAVALCPFVLALSVAAAVLTVRAIAAGVVVRLPFAKTCASVLAFGTLGVGALIGLDGTAPAGLGGWFVLAAVIVATALSATVVAVGLVHCAIELTHRIVVAVDDITYVASRAVAPLHVNRRLCPATAGPRVPLLAARRGLRAPPLTVR